MNRDTEIRLLMFSDLEFAESLSRMAGWNQTYEDWQALLTCEPNGCFIAEWHGKPAGSVTTTCYGTDLAWIGMLLVHPQYRGRGIGRALLQHCLAYLSDCAIRCVKLDATPLGKPLYEQLGFEHEWSLDRWESAASDLPEDSVSLPIMPVEDAEMQALADFDTKAFSVPRNRMLALLSKRSSRAFAYFSASGQVEGYGLLREGALASYLGPVVAVSREVARALILRLLSQRTTQKIYWDIPNPNSGAVCLAKEFRFIPQRALFRMFRGNNENKGDPQKQFAIADPATG